MGVRVMNNDEGSERGREKTENFCISENLGLNQTPGQDF